MLVAAALLILLIAGLAWHTLSAGSPSYAFGRADPTWSRPPPHFGPFTSPEAIATDSHGGVFVAEIADVRELSSSGDPLQAWGSHGTGSGQFELPDSIGVASDGNLFVADTQLDRVKELTASGRLLRQWSVTPAPGIPSPTPCYPEPGNDEVISLDRSNRLYVVDGRSNRVKTYSASGRLLGGWTTPAEAGPGAGSAPLCGIVAGVHHDVYVMSVAGYIDHYSAAGRLLGRLGSPGSGPGQLRYTTALCADRRGDVYVADVSNAQVGSEGLEARVQEFNAHGAAVRSWGGLTQHPETLPLIAGLALDDRGNILALSPAETAILKLGSGGRVLARWNGASRSAPTRFEEPTGIAVDSQGSIYVSDPANGKVVRLSSEGAPVSTFAGPTAASRRFSPWFLAVGPNGEIYAAAPFDDRIDEFGPGGSFLRSVAEAGTEPMQLSNPFGVVVARDGSLYITDHGNSRIVELSPAGKELAVYSLPQGGSGEVAYFANGITMDREGNLYVTVQRSTNAAFFRGRYPDQVLKLSSDLKLLSSWGKTGSGPGELSMPGGIAVDGQGHVLVADSGNNRVVAFSADGRFLSQLKDGFSQPSAVAVDAKGDVYVADTGNDRVVKFLPGH
jgi:DNA-binding beta-propeller fold protein YncE